MSSSNYWHNTFPFDSHIRSNSELSGENPNGYFDPNISPHHASNDLYRFSTNMNPMPGSPYYESFFSFDMIPAQFAKYSNQGTLLPIQDIPFNYNINNPATPNQMNVVGSIPVATPIGDPYSKSQPPPAQKIGVSLSRNPPLGYRSIQPIQNLSLNSNKNSANKNGVRRSFGGVGKIRLETNPAELDKKLKHNHMEKLRRYYVANSFKMLESMIGLDSGKRVSKAEILRCARRRLGEWNQKVLEMDKKNQKLYKRALELTQAIRSMNFL